MAELLVVKLDRHMTVFRAREIQHRGDLAVVTEVAKFGAVLALGRGIGVMPDDGEGISAQQMQGGDLKGAKLLDASRAPRARCFEF
ncbi:MAG: hypothetical protein ABSF46_33585 [Terriglobia bacterium]|jgi:hypothetical protein